MLCVNLLTISISFLWISKGRECMFCVPVYTGIIWNVQLWEWWVLFLTNGFCMSSMNLDLWHLTTATRTTPLLLFMSKMWMTTHPCLTGHSMRRRSQRKMIAACLKIFFRSLLSIESQFSNHPQCSQFYYLYFLAWCLNALLTHPWSCGLTVPISFLCNYAVMVMSTLLRTATQTMN